jgi:hypothetical protein
MAQVGNIDRTQANIGTFVHENFADGIAPWLAHISPKAGLYNKIGPKGYRLTGKKLVVAARNSYRGGFMATDGYIPEPQHVDPVNLEFTPARVYISGAADNFLLAVAQKPDAFEDFGGFLMEEMWDAAERGTTRHINGGSAATVCKVTSRTSSTVVVVEDGYGFDGASPTMFLEPGMWLASLDVTAANAVLDAAIISSIDHNTSTSTATITFASSIEGSGTIAAGDLLVMCSTPNDADTHFVTERSRAPLGELDIFDPADSATTYGGLTESTTSRILPVRRASTNFGFVEIMEFLAEISAKSNSAVSAQSHVLTMQEGLKIELAKELIPFQQQAQLGRELQGGWRAVKIGEFDILSDPFHVPSVVYAQCPEDMAVVDVSGDLSMQSFDGSEYQRMADYDGRQWYAAAYLNRFALRRNRLGALTGVSNPNASRYAATPNS